MKKPVILCVDDEPVVLTSLKDQILRYIGDDYLVEVTESGEEALEVLKDLVAEGSEVPLIISDQIMPGMKGDELLIRIHDRYPQSLKIFLTGQADATAVGNAVNRANLYRYIAKPWDEADFKLTVTEALRSYHQNKELTEKQRLLENALEQEQTAREALKDANEDLENRVLERTAELEQTRDAADIANRAKSEFLANMSHEIRTPMNAILGFSEILLSMIREPRQKNYLNAIHSSGKTLLTIINDILDLSRIESGKVEFQYGPVMMDDIISEIHQMFLPDIASKGLTLEIEIRGTMPPCLLFDEIRIRQILINLVGNSVKFTHRGWVKISADGHFNDESKKRYHLTLIIEDSGIGIPGDQQKLIFEPFRQQFGQKTGEYGGTGLGLTITKQLVEMMGGSILLRSDTGQGTLFTVDFPDIQVMPNAYGKKETAMDEANPEFSPGTVLVVDDIDFNRTLITAYLESTPLRVIEATGGRAALEYIHELKPDLVLLDLVMPDMNGYEVVREIEKNPEFGNIPLIAITAAGMKEDEIKSKAFFDGYLKKPITRLELMTELKKYLPHTLKKKFNGKTAVKKAVVLEMDVSSEMAGILKKTMFKWKDIGEVYYIDDILDFAAELGEVAKQHGHTVLSAFSETLHKNARENDIEKIEAQIEAIRKFVDRVL